MSDDKKQPTQEAEPGLTPDESVEAAEIIHRERILLEQEIRNAALDSEGGSHEGGFGAQGGQVDFGHPR